MNKIFVPLLEVFGFLFAVCGIALGLIHDMYIAASLLIGLGGVMVLTGMWIERKYVGYYDD